MKLKVVLLFIVACLGLSNLLADMPDFSGVKGGLIVSIGIDTTQFSSYWKNTAFVFQYLETTDEAVSRVRKEIQRAGVYGRVSARRFEGVNLPYADDMVNLLIDGSGECKLTGDEIARVLVPRGIALIKGPLTIPSSSSSLLMQSPAGIPGWTTLFKPVPPEIDDWSHFLQGPDNNAVAEDTRVATPRRMKWIGAPIWSRSHEFNSSLCAMVSAGGRLFYIFDEGMPGVTDPPIPERWTLTARDAFNGTVLWKIPMPKWGSRYWKKRALRAVPGSVPRRLAATNERLYITMGYDAPVSALDAATGKTLAVYEATAGANEIRVLDGVLMASTGKKLTAVDTSSGKVLWEVEGKIGQDMTAASGNRVFYQKGNQLACCDLKSGKIVWQVKAAPGRQLLIYKDLVLLASKSVTAYSVETGEMIWSIKDGKSKGALFAVRDRLWFGGVTSVDVHTGQDVRSLDWSDVFSDGHHARCYPPRASENYVIMNARGTEFVSLNGGENAQNDWIRGACAFGVMPCNGLLYVPPDPCFCYPGVKLSGFLALAPGTPVARPRETGAGRLEKGPAYGRVAAQNMSAKDDWPTFRAAACRHGSVKTKVPLKLSNLWKFEAGTQLTQPVIAGGRVFTAAKDAHTVYALDEKNGQELWSYTAGGRIDSSPTVYDGLVLFGSADGRVHCLRASDGELVWKFHAARNDRMIMAFGQLESPWRVHGSVLVEQGTAYFTAGRSTKLDGGIDLYGLDPKTGVVKYSTVIHDWSRTRNDAVGKPFIPAYHMEGAFSDVLVSEGGFIYLGQYKFDLALKEQEVPYVLPKPGEKSPAMGYKELKDKPYVAGMETLPREEKIQRDWQWRVHPDMMKAYTEKFGCASLGDRYMGRHVFSTAGFLDDSWFNRTYWMYSETWPGYYIAHRAAKTGQLLVVDERKTYALQEYTRRNLQSPLFTPGDKGYLLYADDNDNEPVLPDYTRGVPKGIGFTRSKDPVWFQWIPIRVRAMAVTDNALFIAGPPDVLDPHDIMGSFEGRKGSVLWAVSKQTGRKLSELKLKSMPVFDGMSAAKGKLFISTVNGELLCLGK